MSYMLDSQHSDDHSVRQVYLTICTERVRKIFTLLVLIYSFRHYECFSNGLKCWVWCGLCLSAHSASLACLPAS